MFKVEKNVEKKKKKNYNEKKRTVPENQGHSLQRAS